MLVVAIAVGKDAEKREMNAWGWGDWCFSLVNSIFASLFYTEKTEKNICEIYQ